MRSVAGPVQEALWGFDMKTLLNLIALSILLLSGCDSPGNGPFSTTVYESPDGRISVSITAWSDQELSEYYGKYYGAVNSFADYVECIDSGSKCCSPKCNR